MSRFDKYFTKDSVAEATQKLHNNPTSCKQFQIIIQKKTIKANNQTDKLLRWIAIMVNKFNLFHGYIGSDQSLLFKSRETLFRSREPPIIFI